jgi:hypothetical protein
VPPAGWIAAAPVAGACEPLSVPLVAACEVVVGFWVAVVEFCE